MVEAFEIAPSICTNTEAVIFPESRWYCFDYDRELVDTKQFKNLLKGIYKATGEGIEGFPLHVSAHSGGGRTVARMLRSGINPQNVTIFDGIYANEQRVELKKWYELGSGGLFINSMVGGEPARQAELLLKNLNLYLSSTPLKLKTGNFGKKENDRIHVLTRTIASDQLHFEMVTETWPLSP